MGHAYHAICTSQLAYETLDETVDALKDMSQVHYDSCREIAVTTLLEEYKNKTIKITRQAGLEVPDNAM